MNHKLKGYEVGIKMERIITADRCIDVSSEEYEVLGKSRRRFILKNKFRRLAATNRLGVLWIGINPIVEAVIYLFVFTVIRGRTSPIALFIGIVLFKVVEESFRSGVGSVKDFTGGLKCERVRTKNLVIPMIQYRVIDTLTKAAGVSLILFFGLDVGINGILGVIIITQICGILFEGVGLNMAKLAHRIPDINFAIRHFFRFMFYASPALYPMGQTDGIHYQFNELNPFSYFVELARYCAETDSVFLEMNMSIFAFFMISLMTFTYRGYTQIDKQRWELTAWS